MIWLWLTQSLTKSSAVCIAQIFIQWTTLPSVACLFDNIYLKRALMLRCPLLTRLFYDCSLLPLLIFSVSTVHRQMVLFYVKSPIVWLSYSPWHDWDVVTTWFVNYVLDEKRLGVDWCYSLKRCLHDTKHGASYRSLTSLHRPFAWL